MLEALARACRSDGLSSIGAERCTPARFKFPLTHAPAAMLCGVFCCLLAVAVETSRGAALYSNQSPDPTLPALNPKPLTRSGIPAPVGTYWSEIQPDLGSPTAQVNNVLGFSSHRQVPFTAQGIWANWSIADNFTVPSEGWVLDGASFYSYRQGSPASSSSPIGGTYVQIWNGVPNAPGSTVIFGDWATNRQVSSTFTGIYRIAGPTDFLPFVPSLDSPIWENQVALPDLVLDAGTYWIEWQHTLAGGEITAISAPPTTHEGARGVLGANALQHNMSFLGGLPSQFQGWGQVIDHGLSPPGLPVAPDVVQEFPFLLRGHAVPEPSITGAIATVAIAGAMKRRARRPALRPGDSDSGTHGS